MKTVFKKWLCYLTTAGMLTALSACSSGSAGAPTGTAADSQAETAAASGGTEAAGKTEDISAAGDASGPLSEEGAAEKTSAE